MWYYTSDNGAHFNHDNVNGHQLEFFDSNGNLRGGKRDLYEGGLQFLLLHIGKTNNAWIKNQPYFWV